MISVIVPVYNVEKFIDECITSIVNQKYKNLEIILVNDGSTDDSYEICNKWSKKDSRITIINKENGGLSSARNAGLDAANGDYIAFVDSDDYIDPHMLEDMRVIFNSNPVSAVICPLETFVDGTTTKKLFLPLEQEGLITSKQYIKYILQHRADNAVCNKLYKKADIQNLRFKSGIINEDIIFNVDFFLNIDSVFSIKKPYYKYRLRPGSITQQANPKLFDFIKNSLSIKETIQNRYGHEFDKEINGYIYHEISNFISTIEKYSAHEQFTNEIIFCLDFLKQNRMDFIVNTNCHLRSKIKLIFVLLFPNFFRFLTKH